MKKLLLCTLGFTLLISNFVYAATPTDDTSIGVTEYVNQNYVNLSEEDKETLIADLYNERINHTNPTNSVSRASQEAEALDAAYENMMAEENYIVSLINGMGENATLSSWKNNLDFLNANYDTLNTRADINMEYVDSYIRAYTIVKECESLPKYKVNAATTLTTSYDYDAAVQYAYDWWDGHNSNYSNWDGYGGDCANFVSQCLYAGGKPMEGTDRTSSTSWFSRTNSRAELSKLSDTWIDAGMFRWYWQDNATAYRTFTSGGIDSYNYTWPGDAISFLNANNRAYHTLICVTYDSSIKETYMACHTSASKDRTLSTRTGSFIVYNMR